MTSIDSPGGSISSASRIKGSMAIGRKFGTGILAKFDSAVMTPSASSTFRSIRWRCSTCFSGVGLRAFLR